jgi:hypothetical protein
MHCASVELNPEDHQGSPVARSAAEAHPAPAVHPSLPEQSPQRRIRIVVESRMWRWSHVARKAGCQPLCPPQHKRLAAHGSALHRSICVPPRSQKHQLICCSWQRDRKTKRGKVSVCLIEHCVVSQDIAHSHKHQLPVCLTLTWL